MITGLSYNINNSLFPIFGTPKWPLAAILKFNSKLKSDIRKEIRYLKTPHYHVSHLNIPHSCAWDHIICFFKMAAVGHIEILKKKKILNFFVVCLWDIFSCKKVLFPWQNCRNITPPMTNSLNFWIKYGRRQPSWILKFCVSNVIFWFYTSKWTFVPTLALVS